MKQANVQRRWRIWVSVGYGVFSFLLVVLGWAYLPWSETPSSLPTGLEFSVQPFNGNTSYWGAAWAIAGLLGIWAAFTQLRARPFRIAFRIQLVMHLLWSFFYTLGYFSEGGRAYLNARSYLVMLLLLALFGAAVSVLRPTPIPKDDAR